MTAVVYKIQGGDYEHGGAASRALKEQLKQVGADPAVVRRAMIAAYEAEMNVVIHSHGGELRATLDNGQLDVEVRDTGPGIADLQAALREGFSTASARARELGFGAGMGLPNIKRNSDRFTIESAAGQSTRVCFTVFLKPQALYGSGRHSIAVSAERCRRSLRCLRVCPTRAIRVFRNKPEILDYLCIDCGACIGACPNGAWTTTGTVPELEPNGGIVVVAPESLAQFGPGASPERVVAELHAAGFTEVWITDRWERALRAAVVAHAANAQTPLPVISPACPAVVNLIEVRFPALLPNVAPFVTAVEAACAELGGRPAVFVTSCPCQRTAIAGSQSTVLPDALRALVAPRLAQQTPAHAAAPTSRLAPDTVAADGVLRVTGMQHVLRVFEQLEDGLAGDIHVIEPWACDEGCFGSPLLGTDAFLARHQWTSGAALSAPSAAARAIRRTQPPAPRPGLRLDADMGRAIQKLARIGKLAKNLPGSNCGICGAPTCAALAEDIVLGRASPEACPWRIERAGYSSQQEKAT